MVKVESSDGKFRREYPYEILARIIDDSDEFEDEEFNEYIHRLQKIGPVNVFISTYWKQVRKAWDQKSDAKLKSDYVSGKCSHDDAWAVNFQNIDFSHYKFETDPRE